MNREAFKFIRTPGQRIRFSADDLEHQHEFSDGTLDVLTERAAQIDVHGFTLEHDLHHHPAQLGLCAASYLNTAIDQLHGKPISPEEAPDTWPFEREAWRDDGARTNAVKAAALALALIDRIDAGPPDSGEEPPVTEADLPF